MPFTSLAKKFRRSRDAGATGLRVSHHRAQSWRRNRARGSILHNAGIRVSVGSDSNAQINLLEDARSLEYHLRMLKLERAVLDAKDLFGSATETGAASLGAPVGCLEPGRPADFFTVALDDPSLAGAIPQGNPDFLLSNIVFSAERTAVCDVAVGAQFIVRDGAHSRAEEIIHKFGRVQQLWS